MTVFPGTQGMQGIIQMKKTKLLYPDNPVKVIHCPVAGIPVPDIIACCKNMACIKAYTQPFPVVGITDDIPQVFEPVSDTSFVSCCRFQQDFRQCIPGFSDGFIKGMGKYLERPGFFFPSRTSRMEDQIGEGKGVCQTQFMDQERY
jgi:hypothetical protein